MSILSKITKGPQSVPVRAVIYGVEGIGKSELGTLLPKSLTLDTEDSTLQLNAERLKIGSWTSLLAALAELSSTQHPYKTIVIDTADWAERYCVENLLRPKNMKSIEDFGYGKGYTMLAEEFARSLTLCDGIISKGIHVVWLAHSKVIRQSPPDQTDGFDRYEMKLTKHVAPLLKEWADLLLFANYQIQIVKGHDGKIKAQGGRERLLHTACSAALDAKNRYNLPETLPMDRGVLAPELVAVFAGVVAKIPTGVPEAAEPSCGQESPRSVNEAGRNVRAPLVSEPAVPPDPRGQDARAPLEAPATAEQIERLTIYAKNDIGGPIIDKALVHYGHIAIGDFSEKQAATVIKRCQDDMNRDAAEVDAKKEAAKAAAANGYPWGKLLPWLNANEAALNTYFVSVKWLRAGQTFRELPHEHCDTVKARAARLARAANVNPPAE